LYRSALLLRLILLLLLLGGNLLNSGDDGKALLLSMAKWCTQKDSQLHISDLMIKALVGKESR